MYSQSIGVYFLMIFDTLKLLKKGKGIKALSIESKWKLTWELEIGEYFSIIIEKASNEWRPNPAGEVSGERNYLSKLSLYNF